MQPSKFNLLAAWIQRNVPWIVGANLLAALATWWIDGLAQWVAGTLAAATAMAALVIFIDFQTTGLPWRSVQQLGLKRNRDFIFRSVRYQLIDEIISERTIPLGCPTFVVLLVTGFVSTASGFLALATLALIAVWGGNLAELEQWPPVAPEEPSDPS